ncbi:nitroreductase family protein [Ruminococcaceae bacterium OttesenSCG-928-D13]|nr:nitroreductase family protein [Ruminococcaceae bacterium OttesenSCG-928-D13]
MERYREADIITQCSMDALDAIQGRASIRKYSARPVADTLVSTILNAGFCAPSSMNVRPWEFIVVLEAQNRKAISDASTYAKMLEHAPVVIAVCGDSQKQPIPEFLLEDCAAAAQNMLLCAHALGLGAVWCGLRGEVGFPADLRVLLRLPDHIKPVLLLGVGYPEKPRSRPARFEPRQVHMEVF